MNAAQAAERPLRIAMVTPMGVPCGIADTTAALLAELQKRVDVRWVVAPDGFTEALNEADVVHIQHQYHLYGGVAPWRCSFGRLAGRLRAPAVMTVHEFVEPSGGLARRTAIALSNRRHFGHRATRRMLVHTEADRQRLWSCGHRRPIDVVRLGVPDAPPLPDAASARTRLGLDGRFVATVFGFVSRKKGHMRAIECLAECPANVALLIAGGRHPGDRTPYVDEVAQCIEGRRLSDRARITGYLNPDGMADAMAATDLVLAPFTESSGSASLSQAFACGKPIAASDIAAHRELVGDSPGAMELCPVDDASALGRAVSRLSRDADALRALREGAARYARAHSVARQADETAAVYRAALGAA